MSGSARQGPRVQFGPSVLTCPSLDCGSAQRLRVPAAVAASWLCGPRAPPDPAPCCRDFLFPSSAPSPKVTFSLALRSQQPSVQVFPLSPSRHFQKKFKIWANSWKFQTLKGPAGANYSKKEKRGGEGILCCAASSSPRAWIPICCLLSRKRFAARPAVRLSWWRRLLFLLRTLPDGGS